MDRYCGSMQTSNDECIAAVSTGSPRCKGNGYEHNDVGSDTMDVLDNSEQTSNIECTAAVTCSTGAPRRQGNTEEHNYVGSDTMDVSDNSEQTSNSDCIAAVCDTINSRYEHNDDEHNIVCTDNMDSCGDCQKTRNVECMVTASDTRNPRYKGNKGDEHNDDGADNMDVKVEKVTAPDGGWGWCIVLGCLIVRMAAAGLASSHGLFYLQLRERYNQSATATTWVMSLAGVLRLAIGPFVSILSGRFSTRQLTSFGACVMFGGVLLSSFAPNMRCLYFSYGVLVGTVYVAVTGEMGLMVRENGPSDIWKFRRIGRAFVLTPCPIIIGYYFDKRRSLAYGLATTGDGLGGLVLTPAVQAMFETYGFPGTMLILSAVVTHVFVSSALFRPINTNRKQRNNRSKSNHLGDMETEHNANCGNSNVEDNERCDLLTETIVDSNIEFKPNVSVSNAKEADNLDFSDTNWKDGQDWSEKDQRVIKSYSSTNKSVKSKICCLPVQRDKHKYASEDNAQNSDKHKLKVSFSVMKDIRFATYVIAKFCLIIPQSALFLPALVKSNGVTDMQAAYLMSIIAGADTVFRVITGIVLDFKVFRTRRPLIFNGLIFMQVFVSYLYPSMSTFGHFAMLGICEGAISGTMNAQVSVILVDILGIEKLASSMVFTLSSQLLGLLVGPTISAQLKDIYGTYDGAFYFAGTAILAGGIVMAAGNGRKLWTDRRTKMNTNINNDNSTRIRRTFRE